MKNTTTATPAKAPDRVEWFDDRFYRITIGSEVLFLPSATTVLGIVAKPYMAEWRGRVGNDEADYRSYLAKKRGTLVHDLIHQLLTGKRIRQGTTPQEVWVQVVNFQTWYNTLKNPRVIASEETVYSTKHRYAGTLDAVIETDSGLMIVDFKTGKSRDAAYNFQVASYANAWMEMYPDSPPIVSTAVIYLNKTHPTPDYRDRNDWGRDFERFCSALDLYSATGEARPRIFDMPQSMKISIKPRKTKEKTKIKKTTQTLTQTTTHQPTEGANDNGTGINTADRIPQRIKWGVQIQTAKRRKSGSDNVRGEDRRDQPTARHL